MNNLLLRRRMMMQAGGSPTPPTPSIPEGALPFPFSVSPTKQVYFSKGNLQWSATGGGTTPTTHATADGGVGEGTWRFAEEQWHYVGNNTYGNVYGVGGDMTVKCNNANVGQNYQGWIDIFGWGTSGYGVSYPYNTINNPSYYGQSANISGTNYDWGIYNAISNGGGQVAIWRCLDRDEFDYLITYSTRTLATVNGVTGLMILSDDFIPPPSLTIIISLTDYNVNNYSLSDFVLLETAGAVFLPNFGYNASGNLTRGYYASTTFYGGQYAYYLQFTTNKCVTEEDRRYWRIFVRLVTDVI